jgi:hypothetical protein
LSQRRAFASSPPGLVCPLPLDAVRKQMFG